MIFVILREGEGGRGREREGGRVIDSGMGKGRERRREDEK
jgi:hypothetical protein